MDKFLDFLSGFNFQTILSMIAVVWYFTRHIENKLEKSETELKALVATQSSRSDQLFLSLSAYAREADQKFEDYRKDLSDYRKELSDYRKDADQKFYDLLKERRTTDI